MNCLFVMNDKIIDEIEQFKVVVVESSDAHGPHVELVDPDGEKVLLLFSGDELDAIAKISPMWINRWKSLDALAEGGG